MLTISSRTKVVKARRKARLKEEQDRIGKEQLNAMLDKSTTMLKTQQVEMAGESNSESEEDDSESSAEEEEVEDEATPSEAATETDAGSPAVESPPPPPVLRTNGRRPTRARSTLSISATPLDTPADSPVDSTTDEVDAEDDDVFDGPEDVARTREDQTMEAEMEAEDEDDDSEMGGLAEEADMPIEELMRRSGYGAMMEAEAAAEGGDADAEVDTLMEDTSPAPLESATPAPDLTAEEAEADAMSAFGSEGDDARQDEDEQLEEAMEAEEAGAVSDASEMDGLAEDADLPIEELMRKYGYGGGDEAAVDDETAASSVVEQEGTSPRVNGNHFDEIDGSAAAEEEAEEEAAVEDDEEEEAAAEEEESPVQKAVNIRPPFLLRGSLRPYQQAGLEWLASLYTSGVNGSVSGFTHRRRGLALTLHSPHSILADEMGLGYVARATEYRVAR